MSIDIIDFQTTKDLDTSASMMLNVAFVAPHHYLHNYVRLAEHSLWMGFNFSGHSDQETQTVRLGLPSYTGSANMLWWRVVEQNSKVTDWKNIQHITSLKAFNM